MDNWIERITSSWEQIASADEQPAVHTSSVLLPLLRDAKGETVILFEHRAKDLDVQPDEVCFPGGRIEPGEDAIGAAIRETQEELLIAPEQIRVLGEFDGLGGHALVTVRSFAGILENYSHTFSKDEVDHVFTVPLQWFLEHPPEEYGTTIMTVPDEAFPFERIPGGRNYPWRTRRNRIFFYQYGEETIWGLTARILYTFLQQIRKTSS